jgi:hypothetical protein
VLGALTRYSGLSLDLRRARRDPRRSAATAGGSIEPSRHVSESSLERKSGHAQPRSPPVVRACRDVGSRVS